MRVSSVKRECRCEVSESQIETDSKCYYFHKTMCFLYIFTPMYMYTSENKSNISSNYGVEQLPVWNRPIRNFHK